MSYSLRSLVSSHDFVCASLHLQSIGVHSLEHYFACAEAIRVSAALGANEKLGKKTGSQKCKDYGCLCKFPQNKTDLCTL